MIRKLLRRLLLASVVALQLHSAESFAYQWHLPRGFPEPSVPADNPMSEAKVELGRRLFFETGLSMNAQYSCASCHLPTRGFTDARAHAIGATGAILDRNAMTLTNVAYNSSYGWTGQATTLEEQMHLPLFNAAPIELGLAGHEADVLALVARDAKYAAAFRAAFPNDSLSLSLSNIIKAIAAYERTLISGNTPFDRYVFGGDHSAIDAAAKRGMALFYSQRLNCASCHSGFNLSGTTLARNGVNAEPMRIPTLRNIMLTAPYMHDGRFATLDEVITHYQQAGSAPAADTMLGNFTLTTSERSDLLAFLSALTDGEFIQQAATP